MPAPLRPLGRLTLSLALLAAVLPANADVATVPVGAISLSAPGPETEGGNPVATLLSLPLEAAPAWRSLSTGINASTLTDSAANFGAGIFTTAAAPHFLEILSGPAAGRSFLITSHNATSVTVGHRIVGETLASAAGTDPVEFQIVPGHTLATVFGATGDGLRKNADPAAADNVLLWSGTGWETYYHNNSNWRRSGTPINQNNSILYPDEGIYFVRREPSAYSLVVTGFAPTLQKSTELAGSGLTLTSNRLPTVTSFAELGLQTLSGWRTNADPAAADNILLWSGTTWQTFYHNGTNWRRSGTPLNQNATPIPAGSGFFVLRRGEPSAPTSVFVQDLNYNLSL